MTQKKSNAKSAKLTKKKDESIVVERLLDITGCLDGLMPRCL
ncbi:MAG TPA: hypothetical protein VG797_02090 [Phycisphaerales bacterium]|nr:hypothetical protein [Phycisphaerales bacterium]